jgi:hypothetical protein
MSVSKLRSSLDLHSLGKRGVARWNAGSFSRKPDFQSKRHLPAFAGSGSGIRSMPVDCYNFGTRR